MADTQSITAPERVYTSRAQRRDRSRRERWLAEVHKAQVARKISRGCRGWLDALAYRSDRYAKPVWGNQAKHGREIGCSARTIRRYRAEAEAAELIATQHGDVERLPDGRYAAGGTPTSTGSTCRRTPLQHERPGRAQRPSTPA